jgi:hypothetical protein
MQESASIKAIRLTRKIFEVIHGNLGVLKFNVEELTPTNGTEDTESQKWDVVCSFYETLGSSSPSTYKASVNLNNNTVMIKKLSGPTGKEHEVEGEWVISKSASAQDGD